ncbi:MAG TPA: ATP-binding protein [Burkholderiales bacterium]|nr:ATP-binding protein [Burkholderiales bacterium]
MVSSRPPATKPYKLLKRFLLLSLLSISIVFGAFSVLLSDFLTRHVVHRDAVVTMEFLQSVTDVENDIARREGRQPDLRDRGFEQFFQHVARLPDVLRANIYTPDRRVIWSSDSKVERLQLAHNRELEEALKGEMHIEMGIAGADDPKPERAYLSDRPVQFVELYVPLRDRATNSVIGVAELYRVPVALFESIEQGKLLIWTFAVAGGLLLYGVLFWIVRGADRTIRDQRERLVESERFAAIGELSAAVAHGIRNPLASIRSSAELCLDDASPTVAEASRDVIAEVDNLERWIRDLLAYSHPDRNGATSADLRAVVSRAENAFRRECEKRHITLESQLPSAVPLVAGDEALLEQVLCSLYANAVHAMPTGGKLVVAAELAQDRKAVRVTVSDTGHGIEPAQAARLFTPYATTKPNGMGLGLSLVRHIIRRFGGDVRIESMPHHGTRVILDLASAA